MVTILSLASDISCWERLLLLLAFRGRSLHYIEQEDCTFSLARQIQDGTPNERWR